MKRRISESQITRASAESLSTFCENVVIMRAYVDFSIVIKIQELSVMKKI